MARKSRWYHPTGGLKGWSKSQSASTRHKHLRQAMQARAGAGKPRHKSALSVFRALQALANVTKDSRTEKLARRDAKWVKRTNAWKRGYDGR